MTVHAPAPLPTALDSLPAAPAMLSGREAEIGHVLSALRPHVESRHDPDSSGDTPDAASTPPDVLPPVLVTSIAGLAGVGKTALALAAGHAATGAGWFTGSLFVDLHGYDESPVQPGQALEAFLRALGVGSDSIPVAVEERAAMYRSALAALAEEGQRLLIVADNASSADQVRLLLPGNHAHRFLITSRHTLPTLNARLVELGVLEPRAAAALLRQTLQMANPDDPRAIEAGTGIDELASLCGYLPLALHISAALLILEPHQTVAELAAELATARSRLGFLDDGERAIRASFDLSCRRLPPDHASLFSLMALNPGPDMGLDAVAVLADRPVPAVRPILRNLVQAHLIECVNRRWSMHDLVREYATELGHSTLNAAADSATGGAGRDTATAYVLQHRRLLEYYSTSTIAASAHLSVQADLPVPDNFADRDEALAWLDGERANLTGSVAAAAATGHQDIAIKLPVVLYDYLVWRGYFDDLIAVTTTACAIAHQAGALTAEAGAWNNLGIALNGASRYAEALAAYERAIELFASLDDHNERGKALNGKGSALHDSGKPAEALLVHQEALAIQRAVGDVREQAAVLNNLSLDHQELENYAEACATAEEAASLFQRLGDPTNEANALCAAAFALQASGRPEAAQAACQRAVETSRAVGSPLVEAAILMTCTQLDDLTPQQQIGYFLQAEAACKQANARDLHAHALCGIGMALTTLGDRHRAVTYFVRAERMFEDLGLTEEAGQIGDLLAALQT
ncbi:tetratricopeptide repeat protein [Streptomyces sp. NPDC005917]|uniref:tetratricopeptide repeat protein n=1 Tax=unclassified Streptomyces TaxID=2593676 RepID=UPI0033F0A942